MFALTQKDGVITVRTVRTFTTVGKLLRTVPDLGDALWDLGLREKEITRILDRLESGAGSTSATLPKP